MAHTLLAGLLIGIGCILPGVSGGVMAVSFGLYRPMLDAVMGFFHDPGRHLRFLLPLGAAIGTGIALGAVGLAGAMEHYGNLTLFLFTGFILGSIPDLLREAEQKQRFRAAWLWSLLLGVMLALPMSLFSSGGTAADSLSPLQALLTGALEGIGTVVPGVSTSLVLIHLGWYQAYLQAFASLEMARLALIAAGFAFSALVCMKLVQQLFDRWPGHAYYAVLGFLLVSLALVFPGFSSGMAAAAECGVLVIGAVCARWLGELEK